jgi:hypothetical protein
VQVAREHDIHFGAVARIAFRLMLGVLAIVIGASIILWVCFNEFVHRLPQYPGTRWWEPLGIAPALLGVGFYWLRTLRSSVSK